MMYNGRKGYPTARFLNEVHGVMYAKYSVAQSQDVEKAAEMQTFFQNLKIAATGIDNLPDGVDKALYSELLQEITNQLKIKGNKPLHKFFHRYGGSSWWKGDVFERELSAVIQAVAYKTSGNDEQVKNYQVKTGQELGTTTLTDDLVEGIKKDLASGLSEEQAFKNARSNFHGFQKMVQIKTDVQGVHVDIAAEYEGTELANIQKLLDQATFSAKSYSSQTYNTKTKQWEMLQDAYSNRIKLGKSNSYRAMYGSLRSLGYDHDTTTSAYCAASNIISKDKPSKDTVAKHVYHLRYLYELTGAGTRNLEG